MINRQNSIKEFQQQLEKNHRSSGPNQHIDEYRAKIAHRLEYLRSKRHSMAHEYFPANNDILMQSVGSAVSLKAVEQIAKVDADVNESLQEQKSAEKLNERKAHTFRGKSHSVVHDPRYQEIKDKFHKAINSTAYQNFESSQKNES